MKYHQYYVNVIHLSYQNTKNMKSVKKTIAYFLSGLVLIFSIIAILGIWDVIDLQNLLSKMFSSMLVIVAASAVIVFLFAILIRDTSDHEND